MHEPGPRGTGRENGTQPLVFRFELRSSHENLDKTLFLSRRFHVTWNRFFSLRAYERDAGAEGDGAQSAEGGPAQEEQDDQNAEPHVEEMD